MKKEKSVNQNTIKNIDDITRILGCKPTTKKTTTQPTSVEKRLLNEFHELLHNHLLNNHSDIYYEMEADVVSKKNDGYEVKKKRGYYIVIEDDIDIKDVENERGYRLFAPTTYMKGGKTNISFYPPKKVGTTTNN
jgi:hypothetical protein